MIPVFKPLIGDEEKEAARSVLDEGWLGMGVRRHIKWDIRVV